MNSTDKCWKKAAFNSNYNLMLLQWPQKSLVIISLHLVHRGLTKVADKLIIQSKEGLVRKRIQNFYLNRQVVIIQAPLSLKYLGAAELGKAKINKKER